MNIVSASKVLERFCNQNFSLIDFSDCRLAPRFESEIQRKEYEQVLRDVHCCEDRRALIHSKKGLEIVLLYMKVWQIGPQQAMRELITDEAYTLFVCPLREPRLAADLSKVIAAFSALLGWSNRAPPIQTFSSDVLGTIAVE